MIIIADGSLHVQHNILILFHFSCSSNVGFTGKKVSYVNLGKNCFVMGTVQHETLHALGFWHEQARPDRDKYVDIHYNLIKKGKFQAMPNVKKVIIHLGRRFAMV